LDLNPAYPKEPKNLGEKIRKARMDRGLMVKELADIIGVTEDTIINWELRNIKPRGENAKKVCAFLDSSLIYYHQKC
jgi:DNA-binding XRE family transcriptional regulator